MHIAILGGTGGTGRLVISQALEAGHDVTALARRPDALDDFRNRVRVVGGGLADHAAVVDTLRGADAVVSALGSRDGRRPTTLYSHSVGVLLGGDVKRIVVISAVPAAPDEDKTFLERHLVHPMLHAFFGGTYDDMRRMEAMLATSEANWTVVRPPRLTNGPAKGTYRTSTGHLSRPSSISRADLAASLLAALDDPRLVRQFVTVSY